MLNFHNSNLSTQLVPKVIETALGRIEYVEYGDGFPVISIHGAMGGYDQSMILAQTIAEDGYRHIAITRPGYLGTPISSGRTPQEQADLIAALLKQLVIDKVGILAISGGGPSAVEFGIRYPDLCSGLVLVATCATKVENKIPFSFKVMKLLAKSEWFVKQIQKKAAKDLKAVAKHSIRDEQVLDSMVNDKESWPLFIALLLSTYHKMGKRLIGTDNDIAITRYATYDLENLKVPVLAIHGTADQLVNYDIQANEYKNRVPNCKLLTIENGEHVAIFTHREIIKPQVVEFIKTNFK